MVRNSEPLRAVLSNMVLHLKHDPFPLSRSKCVSNWTFKYRYAFDLLKNINLRS